jgi:hypothetical protein
MAKKKIGEKRPAPQQEPPAAPPEDEVVATDDPTDELLEKGEAMAEEIAPMPDVPPSPGGPGEATEPPTVAPEEAPPVEEPPLKPLAPDARLDYLKAVFTGTKRPNIAEIAGAHVAYCYGAGRKFRYAVVTGIELEPETGAVFLDLVFDPPFENVHGHWSPAARVPFGDKPGQWSFPE